MVPLINLSFKGKKPNMKIYILNSVGAQVYLHLKLDEKGLIPNHIGNGIILLILNGPPAARCLHDGVHHVLK